MIVVVVDDDWSAGYVGVDRSKQTWRNCVMGGETMSEVLL